MSFAPLQTPFSPLKKTFEAVPETFTLPSVLPNDIEALKTLLVAQQNAHAAVLQTLQSQAQAIRQEAHDYVIRMLEQAVLARQRMFGASSEQLSAQSRLFDEAEALAQTSTEAQDAAPIAEVLPAPETSADKSNIKTGRGKRAPLAVGLPRVDVIHDVAQADRTCACGTPMVEIGQDISEQRKRSANPSFVLPMNLRISCLSNQRTRRGEHGSTADRELP